MMMRPSMLRSGVAAGLALGLGLLALGLSGPAARAEVPANGAAFMDASVAAVESMIKVERGRASLPRLADPVDGKVLADVWNADAILGKAPYSAADIPALLGIVQKQGRILQAYTLYSPTQDKAPDTARNMVEYQDELARSHAFMLQAVAASLQAINDFGATLSKEEKTEARFDGIRQMRLSLNDIVTGAAQALRNPALSEANQTLISSSLAGNAAAIVAGLDPTQRTALVGTLQAAKPVLKPGPQKAVAQFVETAQKAGCDGLCRLQ